MAVFYSVRVSFDLNFCVYSPIFHRCDPGEYITTLENQNELNTEREMKDGSVRGKTKTNVLHERRSLGNSH